MSCSATPIKTQYPRLNRSPNRLMNKEITQTIASEVQLFQSVEQKENFLFLLGALLAKAISLQKAAEVMQLEPAELLNILDLMGIEFSYLGEEDVALEKNW